MWMWQETLLQNFLKFGVNLTFFAAWLPWQRPPCWIFSTPQKLPHTTVDIPTKFHEVWWKESKIILNPPFLFPWQLQQSLSNRFRFFWLISTRCGCCSYQVSSISVWRVTCYDHFCVFQFLGFWPFPWQRQPFWKNQPCTAQLHMAYDIPTRFHKVWSRHLREIERTKMCGRRIIIIIIIVKKKCRIAIQVGVM